MSVVLLASFQLLVSAAFSFLGALLIVWAACRLLRVRDGRARLFLALLPFAKVAIEIGRGVPPGAFFWRKLGGAAQDLGSFKIGFGLSRFAPVIDLSLGAVWRGETYPQSAADPLATWLVRSTGSARAPEVVGFVLLAVALLLGCRAAVRRAREALRARSEPAGVVIDDKRLLLRRAPIVVSPAWKGVPFARGLVSPEVCFPESVYAALSAEEREAVIQHELGHIRGLHIIVVTVAAAIAKVIWFVPGSARLLREVRALCEICADDAALRSGVRPEVLAGALVRVRELVGDAGPRRAHAFFDRAPVLARRVRRLLDRRSKLSRVAVVARALAFVMTAAMVARATTFGNPW